MPGKIYREEFIAGGTAKPPAGPGATDREMKAAYKDDLPDFKKYGQGNPGKESK
jgi:hypothetical protein